MRRYLLGTMCLTLASCGGDGDRSLDCERTEVRCLDGDAWSFCADAPDDPVRRIDDCDDDEVCAEGECRARDDSGLAGQARDLEPCENTGDCVRGTLCVPVAEREALCLAICVGTCPDARSCVVAGDKRVCAPPADR